MKIRILLGIVLVLQFSLFAYAAKKPTMEDVAGKLSCYCGTCPHLVVTKCGCSVAEQIKKDVQGMIDKGMSEQEIIQFYIDKYGQTVLAAPPRKGFSLTAWAVPFLAFFAGGFVLFSFLKRQQQPRSEKPEGGETPVAAPSPEDEKYRDRLQKELEQRR